MLFHIDILLYGINTLTSATCNTPPITVFESVHILLMHQDFYSRSLDRTLSESGAAGPSPEPTVNPVGNGVVSSTAGDLDLPLCGSIDLTGGTGEVERPYGCGEASRAP